jgi:hypothetical protein
MLKTIGLVLFVLLNLIFIVSGCSKEYEIMPEISPETGGTVIGGGAYGIGEEVTLIAKPKEGYDFLKWAIQGEEVTTDNEYKFILEEKINPVALFAMRKYELKLSIEPETGGTVTGEGIYEHGAMAYLKAEPAEGYKFRGWFLDDRPRFFQKDWSFIVNEDTEFTAVFSKYLTLELKSNIDQDNLQGAGTYEYGDEVEVVAPDKDQYRFIKWLEGDEVVSEDNVYRFTIETDLELTAVRELDLDLNGLLKSDNLTGYILPVINFAESTVKLINTAGETLVEENEYIEIFGQFAVYGPRGAVDARCIRVGRTEPLALGLSYKGGRITAVFNHRGELLTTIPGDKHFDYNQHGYIDYQDDRYGFINHNGNQLLNYEYDYISFGDYYEMAPIRKHLIITKNGKMGVADSSTGFMIIEPVYDNMRKENWIELYDFRAEKDGVIYLFNENGKLLFNLDYDEVSFPSEARMAVKDDNKWGFVGPDGQVVVEPIYEQVENYFNGYSKVMQNGKWGLIDHAGNVIVEPQYEDLTLRLGVAPPDGVLAHFLSNNTVGLLDFVGRVIFEGPRESFKLGSKHDGIYHPLETIGNYLIFVEDGRYGIKSITGELVEEPVFEDFRISRFMDYYEDYTGPTVAQDYTAFKKEGYWAYFKDGEFVTDFKFTEINGYGLPIFFDGLVQLVVNEEGSEGLYDLKNNRYIVAPGKYDSVSYLKNGRIIVSINNMRGVIDKNGNEIIELGSFESTFTRNRYVVRNDGKYGFVDRNGNKIIEPVYDWVTFPVNQVVMALKDGMLEFIDLEGQQVVEPVEVDPKMAKPSYGHGINMSYFSGARLYSVFGSGYFNRDGWIEKPGEVNPY